MDTSDAGAERAGARGQKRHCILFVDDEQENLNLVRRLFRDRYEVLTALDAAGAIAVLERTPVHLVLSDQRMPGRQGVDLLEEVSRRWPNAARILVTAFSDVDAAVDAINRGQVRRYVRKPWDNDELAAILDQELRLGDLQEENERLGRDLAARNQALLDANRQLESLDRMKSGLLSGVTHELQTPLLSIQGYADMLAAGRGGVLPDAARNFLEGLRRSTQRLLDLIGNLLMRARMDADRDALVLSDLDLAARARAAVRMVLPQAEKTGVTVEVEAPEPVIVTADAQAVDHIFSNLLSNAVKFNVPGGKVRVTVARAGETAEVTVADTGMGIPPTALGRVFERFYRGEGAAASRYGGTGLGLSIAKECAERHGGRIEVESVVDRGSTFRVFLPAVSVRADEKPHPLRGEGLLLLLADPDRGDLEAARASLLAEGFAVLGTAAIEDARLLARKHAPHAVLLDARLLGGEPGLSLGAPWFALLPEKDPSVVDRALRAGASGCALKPLRAEELFFLLGREAGGGV